MDTYINDVCANLLTDCRCGCCRTNTTSTTSKRCSNNNDNGDSVDMGKNNNLWIRFLCAIIIILDYLCLCMFVFVCT